MIKVNKLDKYYNKGKSNEIHVINNTSLEFSNSGLVCILGESGSGKTTLLNTIGGLDTFHGGSISVDNTTLGKYSAGAMEKLRNFKFGYIFQDQYLLQDYTVAYNIRLALNMYDISESEKEARTDYVLQAVDMNKYKKRLVSELSGGQQQRIAIARALVKSPDIIFADEPTGNLDEANTMRIMSIIKKISKECLVILVTHERRIAEFFADRIIYIQDGKVVKDTDHEGRDSYHYSDDTNLYLKEFDKESYSNNKVSVDLYSKGMKNEIKLNMVYTNGKLYIQAPNEAEVVFLTSGDETQMVDDYKPEINLDQIEQFDYTLSRPEVQRKSKLSFREVFRLAMENVKMLGKKQIFIIASFIITSVLMVLALTDYLTISAVNKEAFITEDSHYVKVTARRNSSAGNVDYFESFNRIYDSFIRSKTAGDLYINLNAKLTFAYDGFGQTKRLNYYMSDFSYVTLEHFQAKDLICGRLPRNRNEIIIDRWLIKKFLDSDSVLKDLIHELRDFLNLKVHTDVVSQTLTIVGICDTGEPTVYIDKYTGISIATWADTIASLEQLQKAYPLQYDEVILAKNEVLVSEKVYDWMKASRLKKFPANNGEEYTVAGTFPDKFGVSYVIEDAYYQDALNKYICDNRKFMIYTDKNDKIVSYFAKNKGGFDTTYVLLTANNTYKDQLAEYQARRAVKLNARVIVTGIIFILSMFMLYFTMKSNVIKRAQELTIFRMMGIAKRSILSAYVLEVVIITSYTVLPVVLMISGVIKFIAGIPSLQLNIVYPWYAMAALLAFIYAVNVITALVPVYNVIKLPPAQIAERV